MESGCPKEFIGKKVPTIIATTTKKFRFMILLINVLCDQRQAKFLRVVYCRDKNEKTPLLCCLPR
jgi:hypothetical protein